MNIAVRYFTRSGNTEKIASAIAQAVGSNAETVSVALEERADLLFLGCSYYGFDVDDAVKNFITNNKALIGKIVCFGTSAMMKSTIKPVQKIAEPAGIPVFGEDFHCRGAFAAFHKGRPNAADLEAAKKFAENIVKKEQACYDK